MGYLSRYSSLLKDMRFWLILFFLVRLIGILNPPLEVGHNWRQTNVAMVARNFLEIDSSIFYPRIDVAGEKSGITGMEFPIFNYLIYLIAKLFGYDHWYGRLINLIVSSFGIWAFYRITSWYFKPKLAFHAALILLFSIWFSFSRKIMPDTFSVSLVLIGMYFGLKPANKVASIWKNVLLFFVFITQGILSKLPAGILLVVFVPIVMTQSGKGTWKAAILFSGLASALIASAWYFYWVPHLVDAYGTWYYFMGTDIHSGWSELAKFPEKVAVHFYQDAIKYVGFTFFMVGIFRAFKEQKKAMLMLWLVCSVVFFIFMLKSGHSFVKHDYYIIPYVPVMALLAAYGLDWIQKPAIVAVFLLAIGLEGTLNQWGDFTLKTENKALLNLEADLDRFSSQDDLIFINSNYYPTPMYFAHRKGWVGTNDDLHNTMRIHEYQKHGLKYIVVLKEVFGTEETLGFDQVYDCASYAIYRME
jgi:4-amino-4-deoxy-L-arabinose transferase-like glycosyltransferase